MELLDLPHGLAGVLVEQEIMAAVAVEQVDSTHNKIGFSTEKTQRVTEAAGVRTPEPTVDDEVDTATVAWFAWKQNSAFQLPELLIFVAGTENPVTTDVHRPAEGMHRGMAEERPAVKVGG
ncbi:MAG: hypothetical protein ACE37E_11085 [Hyphomicrobiales bacterium]